MSVLGLDIGGANLKAAHSDGVCRSVAFPLWKSPDKLSEELAALVAQLPPATKFAVTMTGELADCFSTKAEGVSRILDAVELVAATREVFVWQTGAEFVAPEVAREIPLLVAAANWHALATWVGRLVPTGKALLIDIGSTTTDIIPLADGIPVPTGMTDRDRLEMGELVYTGAARTPLCALTSDEQKLVVAAEVFATSLDLAILLEDTPEDATNCETANGKPATRACSLDRVARQFCCDVTEMSEAEILAAARQFRRVQLNRIQQAVSAHSDVAHVLLSGTGSFLADSLELPGEELTRLAEVFDERVADCACAMAVARLGIERLR